MDFKKVLFLNGKTCFFEDLLLFFNIQTCTNNRAFEKVFNLPFSSPLVEIKRRNPIVYSKLSYAFTFFTPLKTEERKTFLIALFMFYQRLCKLFTQGLQSF